MRGRLMLTGAAVLCAVVLTAAAEAQVVVRDASVAAALDRSAPGRYTATVAGGWFVFGPDGDNRAFPYASVGLSRSFTRYAALEARGGYVSARTEAYDLATLEGYDNSVPIVTGDMALLAQLPIWRFTPYVGVTGGLLYVQRGLRVGSRSEGVPGTSRGAMTGMKVALWRRVGVRGELAYRDEHFRHRDNPAQPTSWTRDFAWNFGVTWGL